MTKSSEPTPPVGNTIGDLADTGIDQVDALGSEDVDGAVEGIPRRRHEDDITPIHQFFHHEGRDESLSDFGQGGFDRRISGCIQKALFEAEQEPEKRVRLGEPLPASGDPVPYRRYLQQQAGDERQQNQHKHGQ